MVRRNSMWLGACIALVALSYGGVAYATSTGGLGGVPEIDAGTLGPALTVLIGGLLILGGSRLKRK